MQGTPTSRKSGSNAPHRPSILAAPRGRRHSQAVRAFDMIVLFTDFGLQGPYTGQMKAVLQQMAPGISIIDLFADAPAGNPKASAYLLAAYAQWFAAGATFFCVVGPRAGRAPPPPPVRGPRPRRPRPRH